MKTLAAALSATFGVPFKAAPPPAATAPARGAEGSGFDDMASDDLDGPAYDSAKPAAPEGPVVFKENCRKCGGTGKYAFFSSLGHANCTTCKGRGFQEYRYSAEHRANERAKAAAAKQRKAEADAQAKALLAMEWRAANPAESSWLKANDVTNDFARSLTDSLAKWGSLTEGQLNAVRKCLAREAERAEVKAQVAATAPTVDVSAIEAVFNTATSNGLTRPKLLLDEFVFKKAKAWGNNPGALYVTRSKGDEYLGKVQGGKFIKTRECTDLDEAAIVAACADPREAALRYGRLMGACSVCGRTLVDPKSIAASIGPICAERYGF